MNAEKLFGFDRSRCIKCALCVKDCFFGALRVDGEGFQLALCDRWFNPCDEFVGEEAALAVPVTAETLGGRESGRSSG